MAEPIWADGERLLLQDKAALNRLFKAIKTRQKQGLPCDKLNEKAALLFKQSQAIVTKRIEQALDINYPKDLPISQKANEIADLIKNNQVLIVVGETGSGKTTQLPKICLALGRGIYGRIGHTQPRRIAASSVSSRISEELKITLGDEVGYQVRFKDAYSDKTRLKVMTDGILLAEIANDSMLLQYDTIILDEAHERSLNIDFLLGYLKTLLPKRPDLKLIITSATIDSEKFSQHFKAPVIEVSGKLFPVQTHYFEDEAAELSLMEQVSLALDKVIAIEKKEGIGGDVLIFMPGERDIREAIEVISKKQLANTVCLSLYARLNQEAQKKIFKVLPGKRRIILATNIAETSLTVPNIRFVIDSGLARISRYSPYSKIQRLPIERIAKASANQRLGRAGRLMAGHCIRLYTEQDFDSRNDFLEPELLRTNLAKVILSALNLNIKDIEQFPFVDPPQGKYIRDGYKLLKSLAAINEHGQLTPVGRQMAKVPLDPKLAKMLISANRYHAVHEVAIIISHLSIQDVRETPAEKKEKARQFHVRFKDEHSDFLSLLNLWQYVSEKRHQLSNNQFRKLCQQEFLHFMRLGEWRDIVKEVLDSAKTLKLSTSHQKASDDAIHRALLSGLLDNIGERLEKKEYVGARGIKFHLFPGSEVYKKPPAWLMTSELVETSKLYARMNAEISPSWLLTDAKHLLNYQYSEPYFSEKRGEVLVYQKTSLYGLVIEDKKRVRYSPINPDEAREIFIKEALVGDKLQKAKKVLPKFWCANQAEIEKVLEMEATTRRYGILKDEDERFDFFDKRLPLTLFDIKSFDNWTKDLDNQKKISYQLNDLIRQDALLPDVSLFPNTLDYQSLSLKVEYKFCPGESDDGVNVYLPIYLLSQIESAFFTWLVPGLLAEKITAILKGLPKATRKKILPIDNFTNQLLLEKMDKQKPLIDFIKKKLLSLRGILLSDMVFSQIVIDDFYKVNFVLLDEKNKVIAMGRDLNDLKQRFQQKEKKVVETVSKPKDEKHYTAWQFPDLPEVIEEKLGDSIVKLYPAIFDNKAFVQIKTFPDKDEAEAMHLKGLVKLAQFTLSQEYKYLQKNLFKGNQAQLVLGYVNDAKWMKEEMIALIFKESFYANTMPRDKVSFESGLQANKSSLMVNAKLLESALTAAFTLRQQISQKLEQLSNPGLSAFIADIKAQLTRLFDKDFLSYPFYFLKHYPRYLKAINHRLEKGVMQLSKDALWLSQIEAIEKPFYQKIKSYSKSLNEKHFYFRFLLEEFRVSLFAQQLKTAEKVSQKKLEKLLSDIK